MKVYRSKVDWWIAVILIILPVSLTILTISLLWSGETSGALVNLAALGMVVFIYVFALFPLTYELIGENLVIHSGRVKRRIRFSDIREVRPSRSPLSSPALSLDRLRIDYGKRFPVYISPDDRRAFMNDLATKCPHLRLEENVLR